MSLFYASTWDQVISRLSKTVAIVSIWISTYLNIRLQHLPEQTLILKGHDSTAVPENKAISLLQENIRYCCDFESKRAPNNCGFCQTNIQYVLLHLLAIRGKIIHLFENSIAIVQRIRMSLSAHLLQPFVRQTQISKSHDIKLIIL